jgi:hypothetical protein
VAEKLTTEDVLAIHEQIARYALYADEGDIEAVGDLMADTDLYAQGVLIVSKDAALIKKKFAATVRPEGAGRRHITTNIIVDALGPDLAAATSYFAWTEVIPGQKPHLLQCGVYRDKFKKTAVGWRFIERRAFSDGVPLAKPAATTS